MGELLLSRRQSWKGGHLAFGAIALVGGSMLLPKEPALAAILGTLGMLALVYVVSSVSTKFHFHEHGLRRVRLGRERALHYRDVARMSVEIVRRYQSGSHLDSDYLLKLDGMRAFFRVSPSETQLPQALDKIADAVAERLEAAGAIKWGQTATLTADGIETLCTPRLLQKPQLIRVAYHELTAIGFDVGISSNQHGPSGMRTSLGYRQFQLRGATPADVVRIHCGEENFHPGYRILLRRLAGPVRSHPLSSSLSP